MTPYQRGEQEQQITKLVFAPTSYTETSSAYRYLHHGTDYFEYNLLGRRQRMWNYILEHQQWDVPTLQQMANELFVSGYPAEAMMIMNHVIDQLQKP